MDAERLEKMEGVLMDYAVGETSAEVSAMVEALMEREELVRRKVEEWRRIVGDARGAMREKMKVELPAFDAGRDGADEVAGAGGARIFVGSGNGGVCGGGSLVGQWKGCEARAAAGGGAGECTHGYFAGRGFGEGFLVGVTVEGVWGGGAET